MSVSSLLPVAKAVKGAGQTGEEIFNQGMDLVPGSHQTPEQEAAAKKGKQAVEDKRDEVLNANVASVPSGK